MASKKKVKVKKQENPKVLLLYMGPIRSTKKKKLSCWLLVTQDDIDNKTIDPDFEFEHYHEDKMRIFSIAVAKKVYASVGNVYEFEVDTPEATSIYQNTGKYHCKWKDKRACVIWDARSAAIEAEFDAEAKLKQVSHTRSLREVLEPVRHAYKQARGVHKSHLLAQVVRYITTGG